MKKAQNSWLFSGGFFLIGAANALLHSYPVWIWCRNLFIAIGLSVLVYICWCSYRANKLTRHSERQRGCDGNEEHD